MARQPPAMFICSICPRLLEYKSAQTPHQNHLLYTHADPRGAPVSIPRGFVTLRGKTLYAGELCFSRCDGD